MHASMKKFSVIAIVLLLMAVSLYYFFPNGGTVRSKVIGKVGSEELYSTDLQRSETTGWFFGQDYSWDEIVDQSSLIQYGTAIGLTTPDSTFFNSPIKNPSARREVVAKLRAILDDKVPTYSFALHTIYYYDDSSNKSIDDAVALINKYALEYEKTNGQSPQLYGLRQEAGMFDSENGTRPVTALVSDVVLADTKQPTIYAKYLLDLHDSDKSKPIITLLKDDSLGKKRFAITVITNVDKTTRDETYQMYYEAFKGGMDILQYE